MHFLGWYFYIFIILCRILLSADACQYLPARRVFPGVYIS